MGEGTESFGLDNCVKALRLELEQHVWMVRQLDGPQGQPGGVVRTFVWGVLGRGEGKSTWQRAS